MASEIEVVPKLELEVEREDGLDRCLKDEDQDAAVRELARHGGSAATDLWHDHDLVSTVAVVDGVLQVLWHRFCYANQDSAVAAIVPVVSVAELAQFVVEPESSWLPS